MTSVPLGTTAGDRGAAGGGAGDQTGPGTRGRRRALAGGGRGWRYSPGVGGLVVVSAGGGPVARRPSGGPPGGGAVGAVLGRSKSSQLTSSSTPCPEGFQ